MITITFFTLHFVMSDCESPKHNLHSPIIVDTMTTDSSSTFSHHRKIIETNTNKQTVHRLRLHCSLHIMHSLLNNTICISIPHCNQFTLHPNANSTTVLSHAPEETSTLNNYVHQSVRTFPICTFRSLAGELLPLRRREGDQKSIYNTSECA